MHYTRWRNHGDPLVDLRPTRKLTLDERFDAKWTLDVITGCHIWTGLLDRDGYGMFKYDGNTRRAARFSYRRKYGPIPDGRQLDHFRCDNRACVNPDHVRPVTPRENTLRSNAVGAWNAAKSSCIRGHPLSDNNLYITPDGRRQCRTCRSAAARRKRTAA